MTLFWTDAATDAFLQPGEVVFGDRHTRIGTLLGSRVSVVCWRPGCQVGGGDMFG